MVMTVALHGNKVIKIKFINTIPRNVESMSGKTATVGRIYEE